MGVTPPPWTGPAVGLMDLDAFFASVEMLDHPEWRGKPLIVGGDADSRAPRDGRIIEEVGRYNPMTAPKTINLDLEKIADWQSKGAQLTDAVAALVKAANEGEKTETVVKKSKKQLAKEAEAAKAAAEAAEGAEE